MDDTRPETQEEDIEDQTSQVLEEARMVLPGIQALFGFSSSPSSTTASPSRKSFRLRSRRAGRIVILRVAGKLFLAARVRGIIGMQTSRSEISLTDRSEISLTDLPNQRAAAVKGSNGELLGPNSARRSKVGKLPEATRRNSASYPSMDHITTAKLSENHSNAHMFPARTA